MEMRKSKVLRKMRDGKVAVSIKTNLSDARNAEIAALSGIDCIWIDLEHVPNDISTVEHIVRAAKLYDCDVLTRVMRGSYSNLIRPLEADSTGIMVPHVMSLNDAKEIVYYTKFHPIGRRPIDGGNADCAYGNINMHDYIKQANEERFVIVQIEDPEPLDELDEICALPGIDMIFFGPADFTQGIKAPMDFANLLVSETRKRVAESARRHGKFAGTVCTPESFDDMVDMGYTFLNISSDVTCLNKAYTNLYKQCMGRTIQKAPQRNEYIKT